MSNNPDSREALREQFERETGWRYYVRYCTLEGINMPLESYFKAKSEWLESKALQSVDAVELLGWMAKEEVTREDGKWVGANWGLGVNNAKKLIRCYKNALEHKRLTESKDEHQTKKEE